MMNCHIIMYRTVYLPGETICSPDDGFCEFLIWIYAGKVEVSVASEDIFSFREPWRAVVEEGRILGEIHLLFHVIPRYTILALTPCTVFKLTRNDFLSLKKIKKQVNFPFHFFLRAWLARR